MSCRCRSLDRQGRRFFAAARVLVFRAALDFPPAAPYIEHMRIHLLALLTLATAVSAQPPDSVWSRTYGGRGDVVCHALDTCRGGGFILGGAAAVGSMQAAFFVRTDARGDTLWTRALFPSRVSSCRAVCALSNGGFAAVGSVENPAGQHLEAWLLLLTAAGDTISSRVFGSARHDEFHDVIATPDGGLLLTGSRQTVAGTYDGWAVRINAAGHVQWNRTYGGAQDDALFAGAALTDGGFALAGYTYSDGAVGADVLLVRVNAAGDTLWTRRYDGSREEICTVLRVTASGLLLAGGRELGGGGGADGLAMHTDSLGNLLWSHTFGGEGWDWFTGAQPAADGAWLFAGTTFRLDHENFDFWLIELSGAGDSLWGGTYGGSDDETCSAFVRTQRGYALAGAVRSHSTGESAVLLLKLGDDPVRAAPEQNPSPVLAAQLDCWPNPFNDRTRIRFTVPQPGRIQLALYDIMGRKIAVIVDERRSAGLHWIDFDAGALPSGIYFCRLTGSGIVMDHKMFLIR